MLPVRWEDGWPIILTGDSVVPYAHSRPALERQPPPPVPTSGNFVVRDDFDADSLALYWNFIRTPDSVWHSFENGDLVIRARSDSLGGRGQPSWIGRRQQHAYATATVAMRYDPQSEGDRAGLVAFQNDRANYELSVTRAGDETVVQVVRRASGAADDGVVATAPVELPANGLIHLRIDARGAEYDFLYALAPDEWTPLLTGADGMILSTERAGGFVGAYFALYAYGRG
jgi:alpha-N-arabinofuranosidase